MKQVFTMIVLLLALFLVASCEKTPTEPKVVAAPEFLPPEGQYSTAQTVAITCATSGAEIRYTLDGNDPNSVSLVYSAPLLVELGTTIRAKAFKAGWTPSTISEASYAGIGWAVATPTFNHPGGIYTSPIFVIIECETPSAVIRYTTDGSEPTQTSNVFDESIYVESTSTLKAKAFKHLWNASQTAVSDYIILKTVANPVLHPPGGTFISPVDVSISCSTSWVSVRYTTDGSEPTETSTAYTGAFVLNSDTVVKAKAFKVGWLPSATTLEEYSISRAIPNFNPPGGTFYAPIHVAMSFPIVVTTIRYTTDGSEPTIFSNPYIAPIQISNSITLMAKAFLPGGNASLEMNNEYMMADSLPEFYVNLSSFVAHQTAQNQIRLTWISQAESSMLGYRIYRNGTANQASALMITPTMMPATNTSTIMTYTNTDYGVSPGSSFFYWLEAVAYDSEVFYGPINIYLPSN
ncbi:MAG: chitobiase/beta-hexosaminidase C-terminal domain-containing protein [Candidatus Cloacimonadaceae bacterium]|nr:chitobiase/beta-hexosaminidase C-terminal domain-containing protein [Candidatus Cloacimonadaceae bacterium]MDP3114829.1 chitobiase/beta-hexosaminidase C-terminal domain-containing protein [Candidatus Cloacimonadaceae bacterium]